MNMNLIKKFVPVVAIAGTALVAHAQEAFDLYHDGDLQGWTGSSAYDNTLVGDNHLSETFTVSAAGDTSDTLNQPLVPSTGSLNVTLSQKIVGKSVINVITGTIVISNKYGQIGFDVDSSLSQLSVKGSGSGSSFVVSAINGTINGAIDSALTTGLYSKYADASQYAESGLSFTVNAHKVGSVFADHDTFNDSFQAVPEPASLAVLGLGLTGLLIRRRK